jgi:DNA-binding CsgD family transcriptional regulator/N-acetylneuraminic acid mutarotase
MPEYGESLSEREIELLQLVATGVTNREVAQRLSISVNTVKVHLRNVYAKLGAESRTEATMIAVREGWVTVEGFEGEEALEPEGGARARAIVPAPPLPWFKRVALIAAVPLMAVAVAVTRPDGEPQPNNGPALPLNESGQQPPVTLTEDAESRWQERAQMPTRRAYLALAAVSGRIFAIAGQTPEGISAAVEIYDPENDIWERGNTKPTPVTYVSAVAVGTDVYVPGGCDAEGAPTQSVEVYDITTDAWREANPLPEPRCAYGLAVLDDILYLVGGWSGTRYVATAYAYDPGADLWSELTPLDGERGFAAATSLENRVYVVGGYDGKRELTACNAYDPVAATWETCAPLAVGRGGLGLVNLGNELYAIGGGGWTTWLGFSERYDPNNDTWKTIDTPLVGEWRSPGVAVFDTSIYAVGGWSSDYLSLNQEYKPRSFHVFIPVSSR